MNFKKVKKKKWKDDLKNEISLILELPLRMTFLLS